MECENVIQKWFVESVTQVNAVALHNVGTFP